MTRRLKLVIAYDGAPYSGWQSQSNGNGVQDHLERAVMRLTGEKVRLHSSGRTDAGVHALAQVAHVDLATTRFTPARLLAACNAVLPPTIRIMRCTAAPGKFHARFSARSKMYRYRIWTGAVLPPLEHGRAWHITRSLDLGVLRKAAASLKGTHDFSAFAANRGHANTDTTRTIERIDVSHSSKLLQIAIEADGFLYKMARLLVGGMVEAASDEMTLVELQMRLRNRVISGPRPAAPAEGLFLVRVRY
jgi:tRNA pseudouridine38-40 synthase